MRTNIITIGNSQGIRIPKVLLEESELGKEVEVRVKPGEIRIIPAKKREPSTNALSLASEASFAKDWLREEEDKAWEVYQSDK